MKKSIYIRAFSLFFLLAALLLSSNTALSLGISDDIPVASPRYVILSSINAEVSIQSHSLGGLASCAADARALGYKINIVAELQMRDGGWETITSWSSSGTSRVSIASNSTYYVSSGYEYRVKVTAKVYDSADKLIETGTEYSSVVSY